MEENEINKVDSYVFRECDRKIKEAMDNKQEEGRMTFYGKEDGGTSGEE